MEIVSHYKVYSEKNIHEANILKQNLFRNLYLFLFIMVNNLKLCNFLKHRFA